MTEKCDSQLKAFRWRARFIILLISVCALTTAWRILQIQIALGPRLREISLKQRILKEEVTARPGRIFDRDGRMLAASFSSPSIFLVPKMMKERETYAHQLAPILNQQFSDIHHLLTQHQNRSFIWLARRITPHQLQEIRNLGLPQNIWGVRTEYTRCYPQHEIAAHLLGIRNIDGQGLGGLENSMDNLLKGMNGQRTLIRDSRGRIIDSLDSHESSAKPGHDVTTTIDLAIQLELEHSLNRIVKEWNPLGCGGVVLDPYSGEILAISSRPTYDPNSPGRAEPAAWKNLTLSAEFEPGSTFKPLVAAWALQQGVIDKDEIIDCEHGQYRMGGRTLHDHHSYGELSLAQVLIKSSNIGMAKIGERLGNEQLYKLVTMLGFGNSTGIQLAGEVSGKVHPYPAWTRYSTGSIPMGHELTATPLQIALATCVLVNGGNLVTPKIIQAASSAVEDTSNMNIYDPKITRWILDEALAKVVETGTGKKATSKLFNLFGKTGTAQKLDTLTGTYSHNKHVCTFVGGGPLEKPQVVVLISVDEPRTGSGHAGGTVAAPECGKLIERILLHLQASSKTTQLALEPLPETQ
jgi:cell division protein FtsI/penicillin-binding protein 2